MNLLLVDDSLLDANLFTESVNEMTKVLRYTASSSLLEEIQNMGSFERMGIAFVKTAPFLGKPMFEQIPLFRSLIQRFQIQQLDFLACDTLNDPRWTEFYEKLPVRVGASNDKTGNIKYGGDWIMESTGEDIEKVYFTKSIEYYTHLLDSREGQYIMVTLADGYTYGMGDNSNSAFGINNNAIIPYPTIITKDSNPITDIEKLSCGYSHVVYLKNNKLYGIGANDQNQIGLGPDRPTVAEIPNGVSGPIQDLICGASYVIAIIDGKVYGRGSISSTPNTFQKFLVDGVDDKTATKLYACGDNFFYVVMDGQLYSRGLNYGTSKAQGGTNSEGKNPSYTNITKLDLPSGITTLPEKVAAGDDHALMIFGPNSQLYGIGYNAGHTLGGGPLPSNITTITPLQFNSAPITGVTAIACGYQRSWFVKDNQLYGTGRNFYGELGPNFVFGATFGIHTIPTPAGTIEEIYALPPSDGFLLLRMSNNNLYGIGKNNYYQLGGNGLPQSAFQLIDTGVTFISGGYNCAIYIKNGILYGIGQNSSGQLSISLLPKIGALTPILSNGQPIIMNSYSESPFHSWADIGGILHACGNNSGQNAGLGALERTSSYIPVNLPAGSSGPIKFMKATNTTSFIVKGTSIYSVFRTNINTVPGSILYTISLPLDASGNTVTGTIDGISTGDENSGHMVVIISGKLYGYGFNNTNQLGEILVNRISNYPYPAKIMAMSPIMYGSVHCENVTKVECAETFTLFVMNGLLYGMGTGLSPILNYPENLVVSNIPLPITGTIDTIGCGLNFIYVVIGGDLYGAGTNSHGQLGSTSAYSQGTLIPICTQGTPITNVTNIKCMGHTALITKGKNLYGLGKNNYSQLGETLPTNVTTLSLITNQLFVKGVTITDMTPLSGTTNTLLTITGEGFMTVKSVYLDNVPINTFTKESGTITFRIPEGNGERFLRLIDNDDVVKVFSTKFVYRNPIVVTRLSSYTGTKGKILTITASDMSDLKYVKFNGVATTEFSRISPTEYTVIVPASTSGEVILEDIYTIASVPPMGFGYQNAALVNGFVSPANSNTTATITGKIGSTLILTGSNLSNIKTVYFGNTLSIPILATSDYIVVVVPVGLGTVNIQSYDDNNNMTVCPKPFVYQLEAVVQGAVQAVVQASTIDASGQKYYSILEGTSYFVVKYVSDTSYNKLYSNALQPIRGIACSGTTLYFCDPSNNRIQSIPTTTTTMLTVATPVLTRVTMVPEAIKVKDAKLWIVCTNTGVSTHDAIVILDGSVTAQTYASFAGYSLQGIAYNPKVSDTSLYVSTVNYIQPNKILTAGTGQVLKTDATGGNVMSFIQGLTNPIDLTFSNGYLVVDGIIKVFDPSGVLISTLDTPANSIVTEVRLGQQVVSFTTINSETGNTTVNQLPIPEYIESQFQLTSAYSPDKGPKGTMVTLVGYNMTAGDISTIKVRDASLNLTNITSFTVNTNIIVFRMPEKPAAGTEVTIVVTPVSGSVQEYAFSYQSPDLVNIIPLYKGETKYFHFTGHNLKNVLYVEFVNNTTDVLSASKIPVRDVTDTSFDCTIDEISVNTTRCLLLDAFGAVTIEDANYFSLSSETCFLGGTPVMTDQGEVPIDKLDSTYTIGQREIVAITKTRYNKNTLILLEKDCLKKNYPTRDTVITHKHKIYYNGKMKRAESFIGKRDGVKVIPYKHQYLYNVLLKTHEVMRVNGLVCETLYPGNPIAKFFTSNELECPKSLARSEASSLETESIHAVSFD